MTELIGAQLRLPGPTEAGYLADVAAVVRNGKYRLLGESQQAAIYEGNGQRVNQHRFAHIFVCWLRDAAPLCDIARWLQAARSVCGDRGAADPRAALCLCVPAEPRRCRPARRPGRARPDAGDGRPVRDCRLF